MRLSPFRPCCGQGRQCQKCKDSLHVVNNDVDNYSLEVRSQLNTQVQMCMAYKGPRIETVAYTYLPNPFSVLCEHPSEEACILITSQELPRYVKLAICIKVP